MWERVGVLEREFWVLGGGCGRVGGVLLSVIRTSGLFDRLGGLFVRGFGLCWGGYWGPRFPA